VVNLKEISPMDSDPFNSIMVIISKENLIMADAKGKDDTSNLMAVIMKAILKTM
jgi:hypothetical protein